MEDQLQQQNLFLEDPLFGIITNDLRHLARTNSILHCFGRKNGIGFKNGIALLLDKTIRHPCDSRQPHYVRGPEVLVR
jgi:hypothetical protein